MALDRQMRERFKTGSTSSPAKPQKLTESPQRKLVGGIRKMQAEMRKNLDPGIGQSDRDTLKRIYAALDDEGFNTAVDQMERPN